MTTNITYGYLEESYLTTPYLLGTTHAAMGVELNVIGGKGTGFELFAFSEGVKGAGFQLIVSETLGYSYCEGYGYLEQPYLTGPYLAPFLCVGLGVQIDVASVKGLGVELNVINFNSSRLRVMCDIPSRGDDGLTWTSNSTMTSSTDSFNVNNLNDDYEENEWRSATGTISGIQLDNDAGAGNLIFLETIFMRNHNLTTSAAIQLLLSNDPTFSVIGEVIDIDITDPSEFYYISEDAPLTGYRYSRWNIDDPTNSNSFIKIGVLGYGQSEIFEDSCFELPIESEDVEYTDSVNTESYSNVMNERATRRKLKMRFRNIIYDSQDWKRWQRIFDCMGTTLKAIWIPTPQTPYRYAAWSKLTKLPRYSNNDIGSGNKAYVHFTIEIDEAL